MRCCTYTSVGMIVRLRRCFACENEGIQPVNHALLIHFEYDSRNQEALPARLHIDLRINTWHLAVHPTFLREVSGTVFDACK